MNTSDFTFRPIQELPYEVARKIAAGEVIDRPNAVVRELIDNAIDSGATKIHVDIIQGGIERIRVSDNGCGMTESDLALCTKTHSTSKIQSENDLLSLDSLGFRGEALSSINSVSRLEITTTRNGRDAWKLSLGTISPVSHAQGTIVQVDGLFDNFPARKQFLKRPAAETTMCKQTFIEKALAWPTIEFRFSADGQVKQVLPATDSFLERTLHCLNPKENHSFFHSIQTSGEGFECTIVLGSPEVKRTDKKNLMTFVSGRRIYEYSLLHALSYGSEGYFPNGTQPFALCFITIDPKLVDFNIHPAKREARFTDSAPIHRALYTSVQNFYKHATIAQIQKEMHEEQHTSFSFDSFPNQSPSPHNHGSQPMRDLIPLSRSDPPQNHSSQSMHASYTIPESSYFSDVSETQKIEAQKTYNFRYLGQVLGAFLAVEKENCFYLIDQHAAHERILYNTFYSKAAQTQELLVPYRIETVSKAQDMQLASQQEQLHSIGFRLENEGNGLWHITSVPIFWKGSQKDLVDSILDPVYQGSNLVEALYSSMACKAAVKDGAILDFQTACALISDTFALEEAICPHGRPVWVQLSREELFKKVLRT